MSIHKICFYAETEKIIPELLLTSPEPILVGKPTKGQLATCEDSDQMLQNATSD